MPLDPDVDTALTAAIGLMRKMHTSLGKELYSIGWDVLVRDKTPIFIEQVALPQPCLAPLSILLAADAAENRARIDDAKAVTFWNSAQRWLGVVLIPSGGVYRR